MRFNSKAAGLPSIPIAVPRSNRSNALRAMTCLIKKHSRTISSKNRTTFKPHSLAEFCETFSAGQGLDSQMAVVSTQP